jgi:DNA-directed RNA polymerase
VPGVTVSEDWLVEEERCLELEAVDLGIQRYRRWRDEGGADKPGLNLAAAGVKRVEDSLLAVKQQVESSTLRAGPGFLAWAPVLLFLPTDILAATGLVAVIESFTGRKGSDVSVQRAVMAIGNHVETVFQLLKAREQDKELYRILSKTMKNWDGRRARRFYQKVTGLSRAFDTADRARIGGFILSHVLTTKWFEVKSGFNVPRTLVMDPEVVAHLEQQHEALEILSPMLYPMVCTPADWGPGKDGGYIYHHASIFKPVNVNDKPPALGNALPVYTAVNHLQNTQYAVNQQVLEVMEKVWALGGGICGMPTSTPIDIDRECPRLPEGSDDDAIKQRKKERGLLHEANAGAVGARLEMLWRLRAGRRLARYPAVYHVWQLDWRGRLYPRSTLLSPQGCDLDRGLLTFARPVPQSPVGRAWLSVHLANCWAKDGVDKTPYAARVQWVDQHRDRIAAVAADPLGTREWWGCAENPWMFLAACFERCRSDGLTQLPVGIDGTCNGLQHYSAIGLDPIGGAATNLVPDDHPHRIYAEVCAKAESILSARTERPWCPPLSDKLFKRGIMTTPYGLTPIGMREQFITDGWTKGAPDEFACATYLRDLLTEAMSGVVVKAMEYMRWLKACAEIANEIGKPLRWTTPTGMVVTQDYVVPDERRLNLPGLGKTLFLETPKTERRLYEQKQMNGTCPNVIHSFDAAHLCLTVNAAYDDGVLDFWPVHDSYATHAPLVPTLGFHTRDQFVGMYKENPLERFKQENEEWLGQVLPPLPARGTLDVESVRDSDYFFG